MSEIQTELRRSRFGRPVRVPRQHRDRDQVGLPEGRANEGVLHRDALYRRVLAIADIAAAGVAVVLALVVLGDDRLQPAIVVAIPLIVLVGKVSGLYDRDAHLLRKTTLDEAPALFQVATLYALLLLLADQWLVEGSLSHAQVLAVWTILLVLSLVLRCAARRLVRSTTPAERCLVLGDAAASEHLGAKLAAAHDINALVVGRVPLDGIAGSSALGTLDTLGIVLAEHEIDRVIIAPRTSDSEQILDAVCLVKALGVRVSVLPRLFEVVGSSVAFDDVEGTMVLGVHQYGLSRSSEALKRSMDVLGAVLLIALLAPLLAMIALAVRLSSPGPALFRQRRIGMRDQEFQIVKFRTMVEDAEQQKAALRRFNEADGLFKIAEDPRVTPVGRLLRKTSLDELPQLFNVLKGDMSLVGPRPLVADEDRRVEGRHRRRLQVRPGMTGVWQVFGSSRIPLSEMVKMDYLYGANWSLWLDVKILLRTVPFVLSRRGV
jgi:exopolysaccharide biosynthesis polyprenyl glycosylphosphotransferase